MKNHFKLLALLLLLQCQFLVSCKKDKVEKLELTNYAMTGHYKQFMYTEDKLQPFVITFDENNKATFWSVDSKAEGSYTFDNKNLKVTFLTTWTFEINDGVVTPTNISLNFDDTFLQKLPEENKLNTRLFSGTIKKVVDNSTKIVNLKFGQSLYGETAIGNPIVNIDYAPIKNFAGFSKTANGTISTLFVLRDNGKLEVTRVEPGAPAGHYSFGLLD